MNTVKQFFRKYLFSSLLILIVFLVVNICLLLLVLVISHNNSTDPDIPISQIADNIHQDKYGAVCADPKALELLSEKSSWAMLLDEKGRVIWEQDMPKSLPREYSAIEIAKFSRWYLDEYPVLIQEISSGLLVIGCPFGSMVKYNFVTDASYIKTVAYGVLFVVAINIVLMLIIFLRNTQRVERAVTPILNGIDTISHGCEISLSESGELSEIKAKLNRAGAYMLKKDKARAEWISALSHDIRTPLSIILGYACQLEEDPLLYEDAKRQAGLIRTNGKKLRGLVADLNLASRLEYSMQPLHLTNIDTVELTRKIISDYLNSDLDSRYSFELQTLESSDVLFINGDESLIERMLDNIIGNAVCHNPCGCNISVSLSQRKGSCIIIITDDGSGINEEQLSAFNKGEFKLSAGSEAYTNHGIGLQLSSQIIKAHNGSIFFANQPICGCAVTISLPLA